MLSQVRNKEQILIPHKELNSRPLDSMLQCSTTEPQRLYSEQGPSQSSHMTSVLHTVRIEHSEIPDT